jgi:hypothetical protein
MSFAHEAKLPHELYARWRQWWKEHAADPPAKRWADAVEANLALLTHADWIVRFGAARRRGG